MGNKVVLVYSGGLDSTVLLYDLLPYYEVVALSFDYGQRHRRELEGAKTNCGMLGVAHEVVSLAGVFSGSALTGDADVPRGRYTDETLAVTVVPNRNMVMLAIAGARAIALGADGVAYGAHADDHGVYPDCRPPFVEALRQTLSLCHGRPLSLLTPYLFLSKSDIVQRGATLGVPFAFTWSCYEGGEKHCGACSTCRARREAFGWAGVVDPTEYGVAP